MNKEEAILAVSAEYDAASKKFPAFNSSHEGYAVILEELDEMWADIKSNNVYRSRQEAIQVGAMALRYLVDINP